MSRREIREALKTAAGGNLLDRVIAAIAPVYGARRQKARMFMALAGGYTGASRSRRQTSEWKYTKGQSADADILPDTPGLRDRSRDLVRNEPLAAGAVASVVTSVVGTGLALQSRVDREVLKMSEDQADAWQKTTEREWRLWFESTACDATRTNDGYGLQALAFRAALESGDVFALTPMREIASMPYKLALQLLEADQVSNPDHKMDTNELAGGVELDQWRAPIAYHFQKTHPGALNRPVSGGWTRIAAFGGRTSRRQVLHLYDKLRPGQTRGVPYLTPVIETLKMLGRYTEAELMAAVIAGMFTVFVESERGGLDPNDASGIGGETGAQSSDKDVKLGSGAIVDLNPGEKINIANPGRPNQAFDAFVLSLCRFVGLALELPYEVLIKHFTASYSASRGALLEAWKFYRRKRAWLVQMFLDPVFELWMDEAVALGRIAAPGYFDDPLMRRAYLACEWVGDGPISVDPVKDVEAAKGRVELEISSRAKEAALYDGSRWEDNHAQLVREHEARVRDGLQQTAPEAKPGAPKGSAGKPDEPARERPEKGDKEKKEDETAEALRENAAATRELAVAVAKPQPAPVVNVTTAPITVNPPAVNVAAAAVHVAPPNLSVTMEKGGATRTVVEERDADGRIISTRTEDLK